MFCLRPAVRVASIVMRDLDSRCEIRDARMGNLRTRGAVPEPRLCIPDSGFWKLCSAFFGCVFCRAWGVLCAEPCLVVAKFCSALMGERSTRAIFRRTVGPWARSGKRTVRGTGAGRPGEQATSSGAKRVHCAEFTRSRLLPQGRGRRSSSGWMGKRATDASGLIGCFTPHCEWIL